MPAYEWDHNYKAFIKRCSCTDCPVGEYVGTADEVESTSVFANFFPPNGRSDDGFYVQCRACVTARMSRREKIDQYALLEWQNNKCAICGKRIKFSNSLSVNACVDHDKKTGLVRGVLCNRCNVCLHLVDGYFATIVQYINVPPAQQFQRNRRR